MRSFVFAFFFVLCEIGLLCLVPALSFGTNGRLAHHGSRTRLMAARSHENLVATSRRNILRDVGFGTLSFLTVGHSTNANASGGATAGGAYLLSAKQRYNDRVIKAIKNLLAADDALAAGSSAEAKAFFAEEDVGSWKDITAAGYLLSNAFRRNSTAAPDSLPAVKKWKAFAAEVGNLQKSLKKKGANAAAAQVPSVEAALTAWLEEVELPPPREL